MRTAEGQHSWQQADQRRFNLDMQGQMECARCKESTAAMHLHSVFGFDGAAAALAVSVPWPGQLAHL